MTRTIKVEKVAGARDLGSAVSRYAGLGLAIAEQALAFWPDLATGAKDKNESNVANWADFDAGCRSHFDATKPKLYAIRDERGEYTAAATGNADQLVDTDRARLGVKKEDSPTLHAILAVRRDEVNRYVADKRRDLRDVVKRFLANGGSTTRAGNKDFATWFADHLEKARGKVKTVGSKGGYDADKLNAVAAWIEQGAKLGIN